MWRREERLEYWLSGDNAPAKPNTALGIREALARALAQWKSSQEVKEHSLRIDLLVRCPDDALAIPASVKDGVGIFSRRMESSIGPERSAGDSSGAARTVDLLHAAAVGNLDLPDEHNACIVQAQVVMKTNSRQLPVSIETGGMHALPCFQNRNTVVRNGDRFCNMNPAIGSRMSSIAALPHLRTSMDIGGLQDALRQNFLREAEVTRQIPSDRAELFAVFRHVPIELISRLRFFAEKKVILYSLSRGPRRTHTRVYDIAAVRDTASQEIHLIPHRTQSRAVSLHP
jgi:hypothetical protein